MNASITFGGRVQPVGRALRVLVAEAHLEAANAITGVLRHSGYEVATAYDGVEAAAIAEEFRPQVILIAVPLPRLHGYDVVRQLRSSSWGQDAYIAAMGQPGSAEDQRASLAAGCNVHLVKPILRVGPLVASLFTQLDGAQANFSGGCSEPDATPTPRRTTNPSAARCDLSDEDLPFLSAILHDRHSADVAGIWNDWRCERGRAPVFPSGDWRSEAFRLLLTTVAPAFAPRRLWLTDDDCKATRATQGRLSKMAIDAIFQTAAAIGVPVVRDYPALPAAREFRGLALAVETRSAGRWWAVIERVHEWNLGDETELVRAIVVSPSPFTAVERYAEWLDAEGTAETNVQWRRLIASPIVRSLAFQRLLTITQGRRRASIEAAWLVAQPEQATVYRERSARDRVLKRLMKVVQEAGFVAEIEMAPFDRGRDEPGSPQSGHRLLAVRKSAVAGTQADLIGFVRLERWLGASRSES